jgi:hypothetical protein
VVEFAIREAPTAAYARPVVPAQTFEPAVNTVITIPVACVAARRRSVSTSRAEQAWCTRTRLAAGDTRLFLVGGCQTAATGCSCDRNPVVQTPDAEL